MKILCLFVRHGTEKYAEALPVLDAWYARHGLLASRTLWIIDNALAASTPPTTLPGNAHLHPGDNRAWEFSAWDQALRQAAPLLPQYDLVHFVTSAFNTLYTDYLNHFVPEMLSYVVSRKICLGHIDSYRQPVQLEADASAAWVRTCFFFLTPRSTALLKPWTAYEQPARFFSSPDRREFRADAPLSLDYQAHIKAWLEGQEIGGHTWHSPVRAEADGSETLAILNEHRLSISLRQAGIALADFFWLFSLQPAPYSTAIDPPAEEEQLKIRRRLLGFQE